jgi:hypothetical protein
VAHPGAKHQGAVLPKKIESALLLTFAECVEDCSVLVNPFIWTQWLAITGVMFEQDAPKVENFKAAHLIAQVLQESAEGGITAEGGQAVVKQVVELDSAGNIARNHRSSESGVDLLQFVQVSRSDSGESEFGRQYLKRLQYRVKVDQVLHSLCRDTKAPTGSALKEALGCKPSQRLTDGRTAHPHELRNLLFPHR